MSAARMHSIEQNQSGIAKKVLDALGYETESTPLNVLAEFKRLGRVADISVIRGTLESLVRDGLAKKHPGDNFTRVRVEQLKVRSIKPDAVEQPAAPRSVFDRLADVSARLHKLAEECEAAALDAEAEILRASDEQNAEIARLRDDSASLQRLRELLKVS